MRWLKFEQAGKTVFGIANGDNIDVTDASWADILAGKTGFIRKAGPARATEGRKP